MGLFDKWIKKNNVSSQKIEVLPPTEGGCLGEAEQMANVVTAGLESANYSDMNAQLSNIVASDETRIKYVFEHPSIVGTFVAMTLCMVATIIYFYFLFIGITTSLFSKEYLALGVVVAIVSVIILCVNISLISRFIVAIKYKVRFDIYYELLGFKNWEFVEDFAICSNQNEGLVIKDLNKALKNKLIPQGHFSRDNLVFMVSNNTYDKYMEKPAVYDRYFKKALEDRKRIESRSKYISEIMERGEQYIKKLNDFRVLLKDKTVIKKVEHLKNVVSMIFHEIDVNPAQAQFLSVFLNYYLPTTEKLLDTYVSISENKSATSNLSNAKKEIDEALNTIIIAFESVLERLYEEYEMDITSEIDALELVMKSEELAE